MKKQMFLFGCLVMGFLVMTTACKNQDGSGTIQVTEEQSPEFSAVSNPEKTMVKSDEVIKPVEGQIYSVETVDLLPVLQKPCQDGEDALKCLTDETVHYIASNMNLEGYRITGSDNSSELITFIILKDGTTDQTRLVTAEMETLHRCGPVVTEVINNMPAWEPARISGQAVSVKMELPVSIENNTAQ